MGDSLRQKTVKGTIWSAVGGFGVQGVSFIVTIIMARILTPEDYGLVGMLTIFIAVAQSLIDSGFSQGLIRKRDADYRDISTVFYFNIGAALVIYMILYMGAPLIARFYGMPQLVSLTRVISLGIVINSFAMVQRALLTIKMDFKTQALATLSGAIVAGVVGIFMAYHGSGVWSLVYYQLINCFITTLLLWIVSRWWPSAVFSTSSFKTLFSFGSKIAVSSVIDNIYRNIYLLVIGKWFKSSTLGYYTRSQQFGELPISFSGIIQRVSYPVLCSFQDDDVRLRELFLKFINISAFVTFPVMMGIVAVAEPMILVVLGEKWRFSALLLQIMCFGLMWYPICAINQNILQVKGRSDLFLQMEIVKKIVGIAIICMTLPFGLIPLCVGQSINWMLIIAINAYYTRRVIPLGLAGQLRSLLPVLMCSLMMGGFTWLCILFIPGVLLQLVSGVVLGIVVYVILARIFLRKDFDETLSILQRRTR